MNTSTLRVLSTKNEIYSKNNEYSNSLSTNTIKKAKKLVDEGNVVQLDNELFQVRSSSDPDKSYMVTNDSCDCLGFKNFYKFHHGKGFKANCSHLEAVRLYVKEKTPSNQIFSLFCCA